MSNQSPFERLPNASPSDKALPAGRLDSGEEVRATHEALRQAEERFRVIAESIDDVFFISEPDGQLVYVSPSYERLWGRSVAETLNRPQEWLDAIVPEDQPRVLAARERLAQGNEYQMEYRVQRPDGTVCWIDDRSHPIHRGEKIVQLVTRASDISSRKQLESQLLQSQKMEAVGQLAGGVAHDFNNVLTVVTGYARLLLDQEDIATDLVEPLTQIYTAGVRAANLTRQLLVFSRKQVMRRQPVDMNELVEEIAAMLQRLLGERVKLLVSLPPIPAVAEVDSAMIEQVLMNLAVNARDAMLDGGTLAISLERVHIDDPTSRGHPQARGGDFICLNVRDTGCGIPPEVLPRIFEPFFTTKAEGHGTGLGLATVFGIVHQHEGWIEVESTVGRGTRFHVLLPASERESPAPKRVAGKAVPVKGGPETVLLVEDENAVREFGVAVLRSHGYRVLQAGTGTEALEAWKWHGNRISLLFSDLVLPDGLGGIELAERLRRDKPTLRVVLTSGYTSDSGDDKLQLPSGIQFIRKPYKPQLLAQTVRDALDDITNR